MAGPVTVPAAAQKLRTFIQEVQPGIVHAMRIPYEGMLAASALDGLASRPSFLVSIWGNDFTLHAPSTPLMKYYTRKVMQAVDGLHADVERDVRLAHEWSLSEEKPTLVAPGNGGIRGEVFYPPAELVKSPIIINPRGVRPYVRNDNFFQSHSTCIGKTTGCEIYLHRHAE